MVVKIVLPGLRFIFPHRREKSVGDDDGSIGFGFFGMLLPLGKHFSDFRLAIFHPGEPSIGLPERGGVTGRSQTQVFFLDGRKGNWLCV